MLWELSTGERPRRPLRWLAKHEAPAAVCELIEACVANDPAARPTAAEVVQALEAMDDDGERRSPSGSSRSTGTSLESTLARVARRMTASSDGTGSGVGSSASVKEKAA